MTVRAVELANEFLRQPSALGKVTQMQLQKLVYIADGWNWAINDGDLVSDHAEAWTYGPVFKHLYDHTKFFGSQPIRRLIVPADHEVMKFFSKESSKDEPYVADLTGAEKSVVASVWKRYGRMSGPALSELTHKPGTPWSAAFKKGQNTRIDDADIRAHYEQLASVAEGQPAQA